MDSDSDIEDVDSPIDSDPLCQVNPDILSALKPLDISKHVTIKGAKVVSAGAYGDIYRAIYKPPSGEKFRVAIKLLRFHRGSFITILFEKEIYVWSKLKHKNILPLLGYAFDDRSGFPMLVSRWMRHGSAWDYVRNNPNLDVVNIMQLVIGIAEGLAYLHGEGVIHSDIKAANIVVSDSGEARICDFGCSRILVASRSIAKPSMGKKGTTHYLASELLAQGGESVPYSTRTDVWAFGMTVYELLAREVPYQDFRDEWRVSQAIVSGRLPALTLQSDSEEERALCNICRRSWDYDPETRIDMDSVVELLERYKRQNISPSSSMHSILSSATSNTEAMSFAASTIRE